MYGDFCKLYNPKLLLHKYIFPTSKILKILNIFTKLTIWALRPSCYQTPILHIYPSFRALTNSDRNRMRLLKNSLNILPLSVKCSILFNAPSAT